MVAARVAGPPLAAPAEIAPTEAAPPVEAESERGEGSLQIPVARRCATP
jgi:hypothetical protein